MSTPCDYDAILADIQKEISRISAAVSSAQSVDLGPINSRLASLERDMGGVKNEVLKNARESQSQFSKLAQQISPLMGLMPLVGQISGRVNANSSMISETTKTVGGLKGLQQAMLNSLKALNSRVAGNSRDIANNTRGVQGVAGEQVAAGRQISNLNRARVKSDAEIKALLGITGSHGNAMKNFGAKDRELTRDLGRVERGLNTLWDNVDKQGSVIRGNASTLKQHARDIANHGGAIARNTAAIGIVGGVAAAAMALALANKAGIQALSQRLDSVRNELMKAIADAINDLQSAIRGLESLLSDRIAQAKAEWIAKFNELWNLLKLLGKGDVSKILETLRKHSEQIASVEVVAARADQASQANAREMTGLGKSVQDALKQTAQIPKISVDLGSLKSRMGQIEALMRKLQDLVRDNALKIAGLSAAIGAIWAAIGELRRRKMQCNWTDKQIQQVTKDTRDTSKFILVTYWAWVQKKWTDLFKKLGEIAAAIAAIKLAIPSGTQTQRPCSWTPPEVGEVKRTTSATNTVVVATNTFVTTTYWAWVQEKWTSLFNLMGNAPLVGGVTGTLASLTTNLTNFAKSSVASRAWNALTLMVVLHNAAMLSRDLVQTMGDTLSTGLAVIGITDENDSPIDINKILGQRADQFMAAVLGAENWKGLKKNWALASRTVQAASNIVYTMRSIMDSSLEVGVWTAEQVAKIGNGLKADGVVDRFRYPTMPEIYVPGNRILAKLANLDDAASSLSMVTSELLSVKEESEELADQASEFYNARKDLMKSLSGGGKVDDLTKKQIEDQLKKESQIDEGSRSPELPPSAFLEGKE